MMMRKTFGILPIALLWSTSALAGGGWTISESTGQVSVTRAGVSKIAQKGGALSSGDIIATGPKSRAILVRGEEYLVVSPGSRLKIAAPESDGLVTQIIEEAGTVLFKIKKKMTPHFGVQTPYLAAVVKGTTFSVTVTDKGASVQVTEGAVEVGTLDGGVSDLVKPGIIAYVSASDKYRMTVEGDTVKTLDSPNRGSKSEPAKGDTIAALEADPAAPVFETAIAEDPKPISEITGGLISGNAGAAFESAAVQVASVDSALAAPQTLKDDVKPAPTPSPSETAVDLETVQPLPVEVAVTPTVLPVQTGTVEVVPTALPPVYPDVAPPVPILDPTPTTPVPVAIAPLPQPVVNLPPDPQPLDPIVNKVPDPLPVVSLPPLPVQADPMPAGPVVDPTVVVVAPPAAQPVIVQSSAPIISTAGGLNSNIGTNNSGPGNNNIRSQNGGIGGANNTGVNNNGGGNNVGGQNVNSGSAITGHISDPI